MQTGIFTGVSFEEYTKIDAINRSSLEDVELSPLHWWARHADPNREPETETKALRLGKAIHVAVLEPEKFEKTYRPAPKPEDFPSALVTLEQYKEACRTLGLTVGGTKDALRLRLREASTTFRFYDDIVAEAETFYTLIKPDEYKMCLNVARQWRESEAARVLFSSGKAEVVVVWKDKTTGVLCKAMLDWLTDDHTVIADLKSTEDARPAKFMRQCADYAYHRQAAWYMNGVEAVTGKRPELFIFGVVEKSPPYASRFYHASAQMLKDGELETAALLSALAEAKKTGHWHSYPDALEEIDRPPWVTRREIDPNKPLETY